MMITTRADAAKGASIGVSGRAAAKSASNDVSLRPRAQTLSPITKVGTP